DACLFIGLPTLSKWDSALAGFLLLLNIFTQIGFVLVVRSHMLEDILQPDQLTNLLRFRTNVAHDVKYADLVGGRSMARQVCSQDESLQWANSQTGVISDLNDYISVGPVLGLLAIGCWLSTTLRELFNIMGFVSAIRRYPIGESTLMAAGEEDDSADVVITQMTQFRKWVLFLFVALPRLVVAVSLAITGTRYLANTLSLADLILNAVALAFILDLDELVESAFMPRRARFLLDALGTLPIARVEIPGIGHVRGGFQERLKNMLKVALLLLGLSLAWLCLLQPLYDRARLAHNILCSGRQDFIYT
ncbi:ttll6, partial [Symbiodinium sp. CCMP2456]